MLNVIILYRDPNLWMVKCRIGEEKSTILLIMRKFIAYQYTDEVSIYIFICIFNFKNSIYCSVFVLKRIEVISTHNKIEYLQLENYLKFHVIRKKLSLHIQKSPTEQPHCKSVQNKITA